MVIEDRLALDDRWQNLLPNTSRLKTTGNFRSGTVCSRGLRLNVEPLGRVVPSA